MTIILGLLVSQVTLGQIVNSLSADKSGMYYYSVDTVIRSFKDRRAIDRIVLKADRSIIQDFPETIHGMKIIKLYDGVQAKKRDIILGDVVLLVKGLSIIRNQITISIGAYERTKNGMPFFGRGIYKLYFKYVPETDTYTLTKIKSGY